MILVLGSSEIAPDKFIMIPGKLSIGTSITTCKKDWTHPTDDNSHQLQSTPSQEATFIQKILSLWKLK